MGEGKDRDTCTLHWGRQHWKGQCGKGQHGRGQNWGGMKKEGGEPLSATKMFFVMPHVTSEIYSVIQLLAAEKFSLLDF